MSFFTRCCTKKSNTTSPTLQKTQEAEHRERIYNEHHFSSGTELPIHPKIIHPPHILDKELIVGQFGEPQKAKRLAETRHAS